MLAPLTPSNLECGIETYKLKSSSPVSAVTQSCATAADSVACKTTSFPIDVVQTITATYEIGMEGGNLIDYVVSQEVKPD